MLVRLCRVSLGVRQWLTEHQDRLEWVSGSLSHASFASLHHVPFAVGVYRAAFCRYATILFGCHALVLDFVLPPLCSIVTACGFVMHAAQVESWLSQELLAKQKRGGSISSRYYGARMNGPPSSVTEEKVVFVRLRGLN